jgi:hypothetical protein
MEQYYRQNSSHLAPTNPHYRYNCTSNFQTLATYLNDLMMRVPPQKDETLVWIAECITARGIDSARFPGGMDQAHKVPYDMLNNLYTVIESIPPGVRAMILFKENPFRFWVQLETTNEVMTVSANGVQRGDNFGYGGRRKSIRRRRTTMRRKTYRR